MQFSLNVFSRIIYQVPLSSLSACLCIPVSACIHHFSPFLQLGWSLTYIWCSVSELSSENMRTCFQIVNAYIYLSATEFLQVRHKHTCCIQLTIAYIDGFRYICFFLFHLFLTELCRIIVSIFLRSSERHLEWGTGPSTQGTVTLSLSHTELNYFCLFTLFLSSSFTFHTPSLSSSTAFV